MPAPLPTPTGVIRFTCKHSLATTQLYGVQFDVGYTGGPPVTSTLSALASLVRASYNSSLAALLPSAWSLQEVTAQDLANPSTVEGIDTTVINGARSGTSALDSKSAVLIYFPDRRYRGSRPKGFWPWGVDSDLGSGKTWATAFKTEVDGDWSAFIGGVEGHSAGGTTLTSHVCVSYISGPYRVVTSPTTGRGRNVGTVRDPPLVMAVLSTALSTKVGTQRRRLNA